MELPKPLMAFCFVLLFSSCTNDSESDINPPNNTTITYTGTVKSIIDNNCITCHGSTPINGAPMSLTTYDNVKQAVLSRGLLDRISRAQGSPGMMPNGGTRLPQNTIDQVVKWKDDGLLE
jgi:mono/diheme cytochrome c family protein